VLRSEVVRLLPACVEDGDTTRLELQFVWPDGTQRSTEQVLHLRSDSWGGPQPSLILTEGAFFIVVEEPPAQIIELFGQAGTLPLRDQDQVDTISLLVPRFPHLRATLDAHTRFHATTPVILLDLRADDWLQMRLITQSAGREWRPDSQPPPGTVMFEL